MDHPDGEDGAGQAEQVADPPVHQNNRFFQLPEFWETDPVVWFAIAESVFTLRAVTDEEMKYAAVVTALPKGVVRHVKQLLVNKPANPNTAIRAKLLGAHERSEFQRCETLLDMPPLGDRKPSEYMTATAEEPEDGVAAVNGRQWTQQKAGKKKKAQQGGQPAAQKSSGGNNGGSGKSMPSDAARIAAGLCRAHWIYGEQAFSCAEPATCKWQGN